MLANVGRVVRRLVGMHVGHRSQKFRLGLFLLIGTISITTLFSVPAQAVAPVRASLVSPASTAPWTQVGPSGQTVGGSPWGDSGRVQSIAFDPTNPQVVYAGTSTGGVWKTTDEGRTWVPLTDSQNSLTAGALAVGPNPSDIYEFTGTDASNFHFSTVEGGVLASTDAGQTWSRVDGTFFDHRFSDNSLVADQLKPNLIYAAVPDSDPNGWTGAATAGGVYKSIDGGQHWTAALTGSTAGCSGSFIQRDSLAGVVQNGATVLYAGIACQNGTNSGL
ncbi:MAG TPA: hypothetical protein VG015_02125, partial [Candidatus Dormibacteraeota bacterium]|nr:hypothetical protein [Candidatus Dormibacteraeota bacterium]